MHVGFLDDTRYWFAADNMEAKTEDWRGCGQPPDKVGSDVILTSAIYACI